MEKTDYTFHLKWCWCGLISPPGDGEVSHVVAHVIRRCVDNLSFLSFSTVQRFFLGELQWPYIGFIQRIALQQVTYSLFIPILVRKNLVIRHFKVARLDFWVTIPLNFERLEQHHYQSNRKSNVSGVLEKDESFKWSTFHQDLSYHSNEMTPCPILHKTE